MKNKSLVLVVRGAGLVSNSGDLSGLKIINEEFEFTDAIEFGKFLGPKVDVAINKNSASTDRRIRIPREARSTWSIHRVKNATPEIYDEWSEEFSNSPLGNNMTKKEILLYWLMRTQDDNIVELLSEDLNEQ